MEGDASALTRDNPAAPTSTPVAERSLLFLFLLSEDVIRDWRSVFMSIIKIEKTYLLGLQKPLIARILGMVKTPSIHLGILRSQKRISVDRRFEQL